MKMYLKLLQNTFETHKQQAHFFETGNFNQLFGVWINMREQTHIHMHV